MLPVSNPHVVILHTSFSELGNVKIEKQTSCKSPISRDITFLSLKAKRVKKQYMLNFSDAFSF